MVSAKTTNYEETLLKVLACPFSHGELHYDQNTHALLSRTANVTFPIIGGVINLRPQHGRLLTEKCDEADIENKDNSTWLYSGFSPYECL